ncbi:MAG TPA: ribbon-helix-helix protein, CopG family [Archaeoglobaceae archaeon]|nr:ribbon-helix-helix protein, CopG family [Archaeoglobaceae archaeon]
MVTISARIDRDIAEEIERIMRRKGVDRSAAIRELLRIGIQEYKLNEALKLLRERKITVWRAAEIAGLNYREMLSKLREYNVPFPITEEEIAREISGE